MRVGRTQPVESGPAQFHRDGACRLRDAGRDGERTLPMPLSAASKHLGLFRTHQEGPGASISRRSYEIEKYSGEHQPVHTENNFNLIGKPIPNKFINILYCKRELI